MSYGATIHGYRGANLGKVRLPCLTEKCRNRRSMEVIQNDPALQAQFAQAGAAAFSPFIDIFAPSTSDAVRQGYSTSVAASSDSPFWQNFAVALSQQAPRQFAWAPAPQGEPAAVPTGPAAGQGPTGPAEAGAGYAMQQRSPFGLIAVAGGALFLGLLGLVVVLSSGRKGRRR